MLNSFQAKAELKVALDEKLQVEDEMSQCKERNEELEGEEKDFWEFQCLQDLLKQVHRKPSEHYYLPEQ